MAKTSTRVVRVAIVHIGGVQCFRGDTVEVDPKEEDILEGFGVFEPKDSSNPKAEPKNVQEVEPKNSDTTK